jgi:hypothetical protein
MLVPANASAFSYSIPLSLVRSSVGTTLSWKGEVGISCVTRGITETYCRNAQLKGTVKPTLNLFKYQDGDPGYDYYVGQANLAWTLTSGFDGGYGLAPGTFRISTTAANQGGYYDAAGTGEAPFFGCSTLSVSATFGLLSITANPNLCSSTDLRKTALSGSGATWTANNVARTPKWDTWFMTKVKQGVKPAFYYYVTLPYYTVYTHPLANPTYTRINQQFSYSLVAP